MAVRFVCWIIPLITGLPIIPVVACSSRILLVAFPQWSHIHEQLVVGQELVARGHEVYTVVGQHMPDPQRITSKGVKVLYFHQPSNVKLFSSEQAERKLLEAIFNGINMEEQFRNVSHEALVNCELIMTDANLLRTVRELDFELSIADGIIASPCSLLLPEYLGIPFIAMSSGLQSGWLGVPGLPLSAPSVLSLYSDKMTFKQRLSETMSFIIFSNVYLMSVIAGAQGLCNTTLLQKYTPQHRDFQELTAKAVFYITTRDHLLEWPAPTMPYLLQLPGITIQPAKSLQGSFRHLADNATNGIILVSFGSSITHLPKPVVLKFFDGFRGLHQTVIWRFTKVTDDIWSHKPSNVHLVSWLPQNDLLGHPNTKLFITHCGNNGQYESLYHGVPMIGFPMFAEQHHNAFRMEHKGLGIQMDVLNFDVDVLRHNLIHVLTNQSFHHKAGLYSRILRARAMTPAEEAAYWVEHVLQFGGRYMNSPSKTMPMYKLYLLDVLGFLLGLVLIITIAISFFARWVYSAVIQALARKIKKE